MQQLLFQAIGLLPNLVLVSIVVYFYARKKTQGLLLMLIAYTILFFVTASSYYMPYYVSEQGYSAQEMQRIYTYIGVVSLIAQLLLAVGLGIVLSRYPDANKDTSTFNDTTIFKS